MSAFRVSADGNGIVRIAFDRPPVHALRFEDYAELHAVLLGLEADRLVRCIILRGTGERVFQGGHDLAEFASITREGLEQGLVDARRLHITLGTLSVPLIASMNGAAVGNGLAMAALCDYRIAASSAVFSLPEIRRGVFGGAAAVGRLVSRGWLRRLVLTGEKIDANTACRIGLVDEVTEIQDLDTRTDQLAESIAASPPEAVRSLRRILLRIETEPYLNAYDLERDLTLGSRKS